MYEEINQEIIEESKRGDRRAQHLLYQRYARNMYNICLRMMHGREEAEDMLQEAFVEAFRQLSSFRYESTFGAWIKRIVINRCINELKRKRAVLEYFADMELWERLPDEPEVEKQMIQPTALRKAMETLPEGSRLIFSLYLLEGYDHREISGILGISESTSKSQYMHARRKVKNALMEIMS